MDREAQDRRSRIEKEFVKTWPNGRKGPRPTNLVLPKASPGAQPTIINYESLYNYHLCITFQGLFETLVA